MVVFAPGKRGGKRQGAELMGPKDSEFVLRALSFSRILFDAPHLRHFVLEANQGNGSFYVRVREMMEPAVRVGDAPSDRYEEFLMLFARDRERIYGYIFSLLPHHADAEDVFQRCSCLLWRKYRMFEPGASFLAWACGFAHLEVRNFLRVAKRDRLRFDLELVNRLVEIRPTTLEEDEERLAALRVCLARLDAAERELIEHAYHEDRSVKELAGMAGVAPQTLYNQLSRIRQKLLRCMRWELCPQGCP